MKRILLMAWVVLAMGSCSQKPSDPVAEAIVAAMTKDIQEPCSIQISDLQLLDSTTFATEFQRRIGIYEIRIDQNSSRFEKYVREGKKNNATKMFYELQRDTKIFNELNVMKELMGPDTLNTAYYDYSYTYSGKVGDQRLPARQAYATVTPDCRVITFTGDRKDLHKATGLVIPGYQELLDSFKEEKEAGEGE